MADVVRETRTVRESDGRDVDTTDQPFITIARVIYVIAGVIITLLAFRFVLVLLGANPANAFTNFIYTLSRPFMAPFAGMFNFNTDYGVGRFEVETLIAIAVYAILAWIIVRLLTVGTTRRADV